MIAPTKRVEVAIPGMGVYEMIVLIDVQNMSVSCACNHPLFEHDYDGGRCYAPKCRCQGYREVKE